MDHVTRMGHNRTGVQRSPLVVRDMSEDKERLRPSAAAGEAALAQLRQHYMHEAESIGSVPRPGTASGMLEAGRGLLTGRRPQVLIDKLGERLAFERSGVRLYDALLAKCEADAALLPAGTLERLRRFRNEEAQHFALLAEALSAIGADPTAETPCADLAGVEGQGRMQVLSDPRTSVPQCLHVMLDAELVDHAGWELLIALAHRAGHPELAERFQPALRQEDEHLVEVRMLYERTVLDEASGAGPSGGGLFHRESPGEDDPPRKGWLGGGSANGLDPTAPRGEPGSDGRRDQGLAED